jgi:glycosyltransferase involved in cell wall biosynthesis
MFAQKSVNYVITFLLPAFYCWYVLKKERIDLMHLNNTILRPQQWILGASFTKARVVAHERGINEEFPFQTRFWARFLSKIICISDAVYANLLKNGFPELQLVRIYNGLDPAEFIVRRTRREVLLELGIPTDCPVVGIVGNIKQWKGQETVIKSMINVRQSYPDIKCLIIGGVSPHDMAYFNKLKEFVKNENLDDCIVFTGQRNDIPDLINALSVLIHASILPEPFGRVLLEGMALKKPVITTNIGAGPEIIEDGTTGLMVNPGDETALAAAITDLLNDPKKALKMGNAGRIRLEKFFTISDNIKQIENIYSEVGKPGKGA